MDHLFFFLPVSLNNYSSFCGLPWFYFNVFYYYFKLIPNNESFQCTFSFVWRHWWALDPPYWDNLYIYHSVISLRTCQLFWTPFLDFLFPPLNFPMVKSHHDDCIWSLPTCCCHAFSIGQSSVPQRKCTALFTDKASPVFNLKKRCVYVNVQDQ